MRISSKTFSVLAVGMLLVGFAVGPSGGCGSSSGSDYTSICMQACQKGAMCAGIPTSYCSSQCTKANTTDCPNASQVASAAQACLAKSDCAAFDACITTAPSCTTSGGATGGTTGTGGGSSATGGANGTGGAGGQTGATGGTTGATGGTPGGGGTSGSGDCSACTTFVSSGCCASVAAFEQQPASMCTMVASACTANPTQGAQTCQTGMAAGAALSLTGCK